MAGTVALSSRLLMDLYFDDLRIRDISDTATYRSLSHLRFIPYFSAYNLLRPLTFCSVCLAFSILRPSGNQFWRVLCFP